MPRMLLAVAAALVLLGVGCGTAESDPNLAEAAAKTEDTGSSRFEISGTMTEEDQQIAVTCSGEADYDARRLRFACDYGRAGAMEVIGLGAATYMRGEVFGFVGSIDKWVKLTQEESFGEEISPQRLLAMLRDASQTTERVGEDEVRGEETVRYRHVVACEQAELPECEGESAAIDVWIDGDGLVRRIAFEESSSPFTVEFFDFGTEVVIDAPAAADVVDVDEWSKPRPCRLDAGAPLTGTAVAAALKEQGLEVDYDGQCAASVVAIVEVRDAGADNGGFAHCQVTRTEADASVTLRLDGMTAVDVANVHCSYTKQIAAEMREVVADLRRQARE